MPKKETSIEQPKLAKEKFRSKFKVVEKPAHNEPRMPNSFVQLSIDQLGNLFSQYGAAREYAEDVVLDANAEFLTLREEYDYEEAKLMATMDKEKTVANLKAKVQADPTLRELRKSLTQAEIFYKMCLSKLESYNNAISLLSRELSRRGYTP